MNIVCVCKKKMKLYLNHDDKAKNVHEQVLFKIND